jgi:hypothetical protein
MAASVSQTAQNSQCKVVFLSGTVSGNSAVKAMEKYGFFLNSGRSIDTELWLYCQLA